MMKSMHIMAMNTMPARLQSQSPEDNNTNMTITKKMLKKMFITGLIENKILNQRGAELRSV